MSCGDSLWLVEGDEGVAVVYLDQLRVREELGEAPAVLGRHDAVLTGPDDQRRLRKAGQVLGRRQQDSGVCRGRS